MSWATASGGPLKQTSLEDVCGGSLTTYCSPVLRTVPQSELLC
ncbi:hypothetical protein BX260_7875 [Streptomyces sp. 5112.2]|nr:hypothetical protein BX260_7875 [Streptomyces sp. 5112.2]